MDNVEFEEFLNKISITLPEIPDNISFTHSQYLQVNNKLINQSEMKGEFEDNIIKKIAT